MTATYDAARTRVAEALTLGEEKGWEALAALEEELVRNILLTSRTLYPEHLQLAVFRAIRRHGVVRIFSGVPTQDVADCAGFARCLEELISDLHSIGHVAGHLGLGDGVDEWQLWLSEWAVDGLEKAG